MPAVTLVLYRSVTVTGPGAAARVAVLLMACQKVVLVEGAVIRVSRGSNITQCVSHVMEMVIILGNKFYDTINKGDRRLVAEAGWRSPATHIAVSSPHYLSS
jgi:hypothetical protein